MREGGVVACCLDCFLEGNNLHLFAYSVPEWFWTLTNIGVQDTSSVLPEEHPEKVLYVANDLLDHGDFGTYDLALNNCFNFAFLLCPVRLADKPWLKVLLADLW